MADSKLSYGEKLARDTYVRRRRQEQATAQDETRRRPRVTSVPKLRLDVDMNVEPMPGINWDSIDNIARTAASKFTNENFVIIQMPTGTGKTAAAIMTLSKLEAGTPFIVVAPKSVVQGKGWQRTFAAWNTLHPDKELKPLMIESHDRFANILKNNESLKNTIKLLGRNGIVILDEVHAYKTPTSKRSKTLQRLRSYRKLGLTATPFTNDAIHDGISYLVTAGYYNSKTDFYRKSGLVHRLDAYGRPMVYINNEVSELVWPYYATMRDELSRIIYKPEINLCTIDMPNVTNKVLQLDYDDDLALKIKSVNKAHRDGAFESATDFAMALVKTIGGSQVRLKTLLEIIRKPDVRQPLVFYWNNSVRETLSAFLTGHGIKPQILAGDTSFADIDLKSDAPILIQYQAGSEGIEFKRSNTTVFYQNQRSASQLQQAKGRNVRRGMTHSVTQYSLISSTPFDVMVYEKLEQNIEISARMLEEIALASTESI